MPLVQHFLNELSPNVNLIPLIATSCLEMALTTTVVRLVITQAITQEEFGHTM